MTKIEEKWLFCNDCEHATVYHDLESYSSFCGSPIPDPTDYMPPSACERCGSTKLEIADSITKRPIQPPQRSHSRKTCNHRWFLCGECKAITHRFDYVSDAGDEVSGTDKCERCGSQNLDQFEPKGSTSN